MCRNTDSHRTASCSADVEANNGIREGRRRIHTASLLPKWAFPTDLSLGHFPRLSPPLSPFPTHIFPSLLFAYKCTRFRPNEHLSLRENRAHRRGRVRRRLQGARPPDERDGRPQAHPPEQRRGGRPVHRDPRDRRPHGAPAPQHRPHAQGAPQREQADHRLRVPRHGPAQVPRHAPQLALARRSARLHRAAPPRHRLLPLEECPPPRPQAAEPADTQRRHAAEDRRLRARAGLRRPRRKVHARGRHAVVPRAGRAPREHALRHPRGHVGRRVHHPRDGHRGPALRREERPRPAAADLRVPRDADARQLAEHDDVRELDEHAVEAGVLRVRGAAVGRVLRAAGARRVRAGGHRFGEADAAVRAGGAHQRGGGAGSPVFRAKSGGDLRSAGMCEFRGEVVWWNFWSLLL